ncbi:MAG: VWA domain-containing protein [Gordonia sp. (in: high G+C Gram-positive bacteria)]
MRSRARNSRWRTGATLVAAVTLALSGCATSTDGTAQKAASSTAEKPKAVPTIVVVDASDSMNTADAPGPRIDAAKSAVRALADSLPSGADFGMVAFGSTKPLKGTPADVACGDIQTSVPLGPLNKTQLTAALDGLKAQGRTPIAKALDAAAQQVPAGGAASIVLVSDGASTCQPDPCQTSAAIRQAHPDVTVSAVGFRTDDPALKCVAEKGGGLFVTADNAAQLTARLAAAQDAQSAATKLTPTSRGGIEIGQRIDDVRKNNADFPSTGTRDGDRTVYVYADCTYVVEHDVVVEIAPGNPPGSAGTTIDGVGKGTAGKRAVELYGEAVSDSDGVAVFAADKAAGTAYRIGYDGADSVASGTVTTVVLCGCLAEAQKSAKKDDGPQVVEIVAVDKSGQPINGFTRGQVMSATFEAKYCSPGLGAINPGVYSCGTTADGAVNCWPSGSKLLCTGAPDQKELREYAYTGTLTPEQPKPDVKPWALTLADGTKCLKKYGGSWDRPPAGYMHVYYCDTKGSYTYVYVRDGDDPPLFDKSGKQWTVLFGTNTSTPRAVGVTSVTYSAAP